MPRSLAEPPREPDSEPPEDDVPPELMPPPADEPDDDASPPAEPDEPAPLMPAPPEEPDEPDAPDDELPALDGLDEEPWSDFCANAPTGAATIAIAAAVLRRIFLMNKALIRRDFVRFISAPSAPERRQVRIVPELPR
ncbi:hypothetical protein [Hansschlegelia sp.]|uniref:hypothetical protein n=1 Tax=Hansschlegelia sp. TaxID=2041892 RepID=UPI002B56C547|nr:hypothetical protein [Hansschlegelia sp.]HVI28173.1 hypothetical protein [Hansschlegelia sp.]